MFDCCFFLGGGDNFNLTYCWIYNLFIYYKGCTNDATTSACAIPIKSRHLGTGQHYAQYNAWSTGDSFLDWYGQEHGQQSYHGKSPSGTPAVWTTNVEGASGHTTLNT